MTSQSKPMEIAHAPYRQQSVLSVEGVYHRFDTLVAVRGVDLEVAPGEVVCLLGPSGCGKTTLLRIAAGLEVLQQGRVLLNGKEVAVPKGRHVPPEKRNVGLAFQDSALFPHLTVLENVTLDRKSTRLNSSHVRISYAVFCLKKKNIKKQHN